MEFHQLRYFVAAATDLNISKAAARLFISQPSMSRQIALLEDELGVRLFDRVRKRIHLTEAGVFFLKRANQILCDAETASQQVREQFGGQRPTLRLGFILKTAVENLCRSLVLRMDGAWRTISAAERNSRDVNRQ